MSESAPTLEDGPESAPWYLRGLKLRAGFTDVTRGPHAASRTALLAMARAVPLLELRRASPKLRTESKKAWRAKKHGKHGENKEEKKQKTDRAPNSRVGP